MNSYNQQIQNGDQSEDNTGTYIFIGFVLLAIATAVVALFMFGGPIIASIKKNASSTATDIKNDIKKKVLSTATLGIAECTKDSDCKKGEKCSGWGGSGFKCQPKSKEGGDCTTTSGCIDGLWCTPGSTCSTKKKDGEYCPLNDNACNSGKCGNGSICLTKDGHIPEGSPGCLNDSDCGPKMKCSGWGGKGVICQKLGKVGDACTYDSGCESGLRCRLSKCKKLGKVGDACTYTSGCDNKLWCSTSLTCQPKKKSGEYCPLNDNACLSGNCRWWSKCH